MEQVLPITRSFRCAWYTEYVCFAAKVFERREGMQVGTERSEVWEEDFQESLCSRHCNYSVIKMRNVLELKSVCFRV